MSNDSPYRFVSLGSHWPNLQSSTVRDGVRIRLAGWQFKYTNAQREMDSWCFGTDELDAYKCALGLIAQMEKRYFKRQEAKRVAEVHS